MLFDDLHEFRTLLNQEPGKADNTKKKYYQSAKNIVMRTGYASLEDIPPSAIEKELKALETKNDVSAAKRGLEYLAGYFPQLKLPPELGEVSKHKRNYKKRTWQPLNLDKLQRTVNSLKNPKLKYAGTVADETDKMAAQQMLNDFFKTLYSEPQNKINYYLSNNANEQKFIALNLNNSMTFQKIDSLILYKTSSPSEYTAIVSIKIADLNGTEMRQRFNMHLVKTDKFYAKDINLRTYNLKI